MRAAVTAGERIYLRDSSFDEEAAKGAGLADGRAPMARGLERGDPVEVVTKLKAEIDGSLEVAGAALGAPIVQAGLADEYRIVVAPTPGGRLKLS